MKYTEKHKTPRQERFSCWGVEWDWGLVEADAGDIGFLLRKRQSVDFYEAGIVTLGLVEGEVLDAVLGTELHEEVGELSQFGTEPFYIVG